MYGFKQVKLTTEQRRALIDSDSCFIPIVLEESQQLYLVDLEIAQKRVTVYTADNFDDRRLETLEGAQSESVLKMISDYVFFLESQVRFGEKVCQNGSSTDESPIDM